MAHKKKQNSTHEATAVRAMKAFRTAVRRAVSDLGTEGAAIEVLKLLVHQEGEGEAAAKLPPLIRLPEEPTHAQAIRAMERLERDGRNLQEVRRAVDGMFPGRPREFVRRRFRLYREMIGAKKTRGVGTMPRRSG